MKAIQVFKLENGLELENGMSVEITTSDDEFYRAVIVSMTSKGIELDVVDSIIKWDEIETVEEV